MNVALCPAASVVLDCKGSRQFAVKLLVYLGSTIGSVLLHMIKLTRLICTSHAA